MNPNNPRWKKFGGSGVIFYKGWIDDFQQFLSDMGPRPENSFLRRKNHTGNFEPNNTVWGDRRNAAGQPKSKITSKKQKLPPEYKVWYAMIRRCYYSQNSPSWKHYGGRGITVCERWRNSFHAFLSDVGNRPDPHLEIDRIDNDGNYEPGNVRWATPSQQHNNTRNQKRRTRGVYFDSSTGLYRVILLMNGRQKYIQSCQTEEEGVTAYSEARKRFHLD